MKTNTVSMNGLSNKIVLRLTVAWPEERLVDFLKRFENISKMYMENDSSAVSMAGVGIAVRLDAVGKDRFSEIRKKSAQLFSIIKHISNPESSMMPLLIGGFSFVENSHPKELWADFPDATFILPHYMLTNIDGKQFLSINQILPFDTDLEEAESKMRLEADNLRSGMKLNNGNPPRSENHSKNKVENFVSQHTWETMVSNTINRIDKGEVEKVVLARVCHVKSNQQFNISRSLDILSDDYPGCYRFWFEFNPGHVFFGATPERLANLHDGNFATVALAGSIARGITADEDRHLAMSLLIDEKERHEHQLVVKDLQSRLENIVSNMKIAEQPSVATLSNIQHLQTDISGKTKDEFNILDLVEELHPTAALGGFPRKVALQLIREIETLERGWYGAPIGWFNAVGNGEFAVAIRSGVVSGKDAWLYSGAGIVANSNPTSEWRESQIKLEPMLTALSGE